mgnify:CR=1 FL=1
MILICVSLPQLRQIPVTSIKSSLSLASGSASIIPSEVSEDSVTVSAMMVSVVENGGGRRAKVPGYLVAGKTGTAQMSNPKGGYYDDRTIQSFVGFAPANSPKFSILIRLDNPKQSDAASSCAAPIFGKLAKYIIDLKQIPSTEIVK